MDFREGAGHRQHGEGLNAVTSQALSGARRGVRFRDEFVSSQSDHQGRQGATPGPSTRLESTPRTAMVSYWTPTQPQATASGTPARAALQQQQLAPAASPYENVKRLLQRTPRSHRGTNDILEASSARRLPSSIPLPSAHASPLPSPALSGAGAPGLGQQAGAQLTFRHGFGGLGSSQQSSRLSRPAGAGGLQMAPYAVRNGPLFPRSVAACCSLGVLCPILVFALLFYPMCIACPPLPSPPHPHPPSAAVMRILCCCIQGCQQVRGHSRRIAAAEGQGSAASCSPQGHLRCTGASFFAWGSCTCTCCIRRTIRRRRRACGCCVVVAYACRGTGAEDAALIPGGLAGGPWTIGWQQAAAGPRGGG